MPFKTDEKFDNGQGLIELGLDLERIGKGLATLGETVRSHEDEPIGQIGNRIHMVRMAVNAWVADMDAAWAKLSIDVDD